MSVAYLVGRWFMQSYRRKAEASSYGQVARNLKKQGIPLTIARIVLFWKI